MGSFFRSEEMALCQLFVQPEAAYSSLAILGEQAVVQFRDLNSDVNQFQRKFVGEVRRCDEMERKMRYIEVELAKDSVHVPDLENVPDAPNPREISELEARVEKSENEIRELSNNYVSLQSNYLELQELKHVLEKTDTLLSQNQEFGHDSLSRALMGEEGAHIPPGRLGFLAGIIVRERVPAFEKMLWRISRGNVLLRQASIEEPLLDPITRSDVYKTVFVCIFQGEELKSRVQKICAGFRASVYPCPSTLEERREMLHGVKTRLEDIKLVLNQTEDHRQKVLRDLAKELPGWIVRIRKMKAVYHALNMFNVDVTKKCLIGECWVPTGDIKIVDDALREGGRVGGSSIPSFLNQIETMENPPTFNRTNKFTRGFQNLIDAYGISSYREVNPALYTIITFPFLFAVMFGDAGHGMILTLFALTMVLTEKKTMKRKKLGEVEGIFFGGRYIILLMGFFSIYTGLLYNDVFSKSLNIFKSSWRVTYNFSTLTHNKDLQLDPGVKDYVGTPYPFGIDPVWQLASANKIVFMNSFKMKLSIILGVVHMIFGLTLRVFNDIHFKKPSGIILEFVPQLLFMSFLFLYLVALIFVKWIMFTATNDDDLALGSSCANSVLLMFINMMLMQSSEVKEHCREYFFEGQNIMQIIFVVLAVLCIPVMLLGKPLHHLFTQRRKNKSLAKSEQYESGDVNQAFELQPSDREALTNGGQMKPNSQSEHEEEEPFSDIMIHQAIHTIEYVLSTISHTASYLRLWALSLAHAQLSEVLWSLVMGNALHFTNYIGAVAIFAIFAVWAAGTVGILVMMEGLSAFLHTLRLHWVEFMSKFYSGTGYIFEPFSFSSFLEDDDSNEK